MNFGDIVPKNATVIKKKRVSYRYDALNRITAGISNNSNYNLNSVAYDKNGNITNLSRNGHLNIGATSFGLMDNLTYSYDSGNKLLKIADSAPNDQFGFKDDAVNTTADTSNDYTYDANGNMLTDTNKGITTDIQYNHLNLPTTVTLGGGTVTYVYDATGVKQRKIVSTGTTTDYAGNFVYENNVLQFFNHPEGYVKNDNGIFSHVYQYKDHLGNVRLSYTDANNNGAIAQSEIIEETNYYPFGLQHKGYNNIISSNGNSTAQKFGFGGKELSEELGLNWHDFSARNYDASLGKWFNLDPKADATDLVSSSPYSYALNNPITFRDPEGDCPPGVDCVAIAIRVKAGWNSLKSSFSKKVDNANRISSGMVNTFDRADKTVGGGGISSYRKASIYASRYLKEFGDFSSINDVSVLKDGRNLSGEKASKTDYGFAAAAVLLPISGSKIKGLAGEGLDALTNIFNKTSNQSKHLDAKHINAAVGDILGNPIIINGKTYDHLDEVQNALNGVGNQLGKLNKQIDAGNFSGEVLDAAQNMRSTLQKQKDEITDVLNRAYNKANE